jgi:hypothetical protein
MIIQIIMSLCPVCGRVYCDHTPGERGQTSEEMNRPLTDYELKAWESTFDSTGYKPEKVAAARRSQAEVEAKRSLGAERNQG